MATYSLPSQYSLTITDSFKTIRIVNNADSSILHSLNKNHIQIVNASQERIVLRDETAEVAFFWTSVTTPAVATKQALIEILDEYLQEEVRVTP
jgi:hypothetical protein